MVVAEEKNRVTYNFSPSPRLMEEFYSIAERLGLPERSRWVAISAALLLMLEVDESILRVYFETVRGKGKDEGPTEELIRMARSGDLRREAERRLRLTRLDLEKPRPQVGGDAPLRKPEEPPPPKHPRRK